MARDKGNYPQLYDALRYLRLHADSGLDPDVMARVPALCQAIGNGDPWMAVGDLRDRLRSAAARGDREVAALMHALASKGDATRRLTYAGEQIHVEYRRARDLSDLGILKIAEQIGARQTWDVPIMGLNVTVRNGKITVSGSVMVPTGFPYYQHPSLKVDGRVAEVGDEVEFESGGSDGWETHLYGPLSTPLSKPVHEIGLFRVGSPRMRCRLITTSDDPDVRFVSWFVYLQAQVEVKLHAGATT